MKPALTAAAGQDRVDSCWCLGVEQALELAFQVQMELREQGALLEPLLPHSRRRFIILRLWSPLRRDAA